MFRSPAYFAIAALVLVATLGPADAPLLLSDEPDSAELRLNEDRESLVQRHNALAQCVHNLWQAGRDREAFASLEKLLELYREIYPQSEFPNGHPHMVNCYGDLCRVADQLAEFDALLRFS